MEIRYGSAQLDSPDSEGERKILAAAERLFADRGYDSVSVSQIAELAGMSKGNIFHHFKSKENLYLAALRGAGMRTATTQDDGEQSLDPLPVRRLRKLFCSQLHRLTQDHQATRLVLRELLDHGSARSKELAEDIYAEAFARSVSWVREGQQSGELRQGLDPGLLAFLLLAANVFMFQAEPIFKYMEDAAFVLDPDKYSQAVFDLLLQGAVEERS
ncbi:MAG: TetR/AcrR family transcriptional regulator [Pseudomonadales bacterium]